MGAGHSRERNQPEQRPRGGRYRKSMSDHKQYSLNELDIQNISPLPQVEGLGLG